MTDAVDLFAGGGGLTLAAMRAGVRVLLAANHSRRAVDTHRANHPHVIHLCQDLRQADWHAMPRMDILLGASACQGHAKSATRGGTGRRGSAPKHDADRATAWALVSCLEVHRPPLGIFENVPEFLQWELYGAWEQALRSLGYALALHIVDAADFGVPQHRVRLFMVVTRTHAPLHLQFQRAPHRAFRSCIDPKADGWAPIATKSAAIQGRVAAGRIKFAGDFLSQHTTDHRGRSLDRPIGAITASGDCHWNLVRGDRMRPLSAVELRRAMGFPDEYVLPDSKSAATVLLGNAVAPPCGEAVIRAALEAA